MLTWNKQQVPISALLFFQVVKSQIPSCWFILLQAMNLIEPCIWIRGVLERPKYFSANW